MARSTRLTTAGDGSGPALDVVHTGAAAPAGTDTPVSAIVLTDGSSTGSLVNASNPMPTYSVDGAHVAIGTTTDPAYTGTGATTNIGGLKGIFAKLAGTLTLAGTFTQSGVGDMGGDTTAGTTDGGKPVGIGGIGLSASPTAVTTGQRVKAWFDLLGRQLVGFTPRELHVSGTTGATPLATTTSTQLIAAPGAGKYLAVTALSLSNESASVGTRATLLSGTTAKWPVYCGVNGGGEAITSPVPLFYCGVNEALNVQCGTNSAALNAAVSAHICG